MMRRMVSAYEREWDERTRAHREYTAGEAREARMSLFESVVKWGAVGAASLGLLFSLYMESRRQEAQPFEMLLPHPGRERNEPLVQTHVPAARRERQRATGEDSAGVEERTRARVAAQLQLLEDEREEGVSPQRRAVLLLNEMAGNSFASNAWEHGDPHAYTSRPETVVGAVGVREEGAGAEVHADDFVHLHFSHPDQPNLQYRETLKLGRDPCTPALRDAIVGKPSNTVLSFEYAPAAGKPAEPRVVHVQSHADLLKEMVEDTEKDRDRAMVIEGIRGRAF